MGGSSLPRILSLDIQAGPVVAWADNHGGSGVLCWAGRRDLAEARRSFSEWMAGQVANDCPARLVLVLRALNPHTPPSEAALGMRDTAIGHAQSAQIRVSGARAEGVHRAVTGGRRREGETMGEAVRRLCAALKRHGKGSVQPIEAYAASVLLLVERVSGEPAR